MIEFSEVKIQNILAFAVILFTWSCGDGDKKEAKQEVVLWHPYNDSSEVAANADHESEQMRYKFIQSKVLDKNEVFRPLYEEVSKFTEDAYKMMKPLVIEQNIPSIQKSVSEGKFSYEDLVLFYLYRIYQYELDNQTTLNTVIALNEKVVGQARELDEQRKANPSEKQHPIFGMPILLKDNINTDGMRTTAGAVALLANEVDDAFIVERLKSKGALILGKVNLSEWANFICDGCPNGQSAVGGQTLNPYGRREFDTGGSSAGSGTSTAANYAVAAIGTETSGSILSPSSQNSVVGLKPTIGLLSRTGIVPISSTLDTPGPMTKNVTDNAILLDALLGKDDQDSKSVEGPNDILATYQNPKPVGEIRLGAIKSLMAEDSIYAVTVSKLKEAGAEIVEFVPPEVEMRGFLSVLNIDMKNDLPAYLEAHVKNTEGVEVRSVADVVRFNTRDSAVRIPYKQEQLDSILTDPTTEEELIEIKERLQKNGRAFFDAAMDKYNLDAILSKNNYHAGYAAMAEYPALTVPMGYKESGEPVSLTFIAKPFQEALLLRLGKSFEDMTAARRLPDGYK